MVEQYRMDLHKIPEIGFNEYETKKYLLSIISKYNNCIVNEVQTGIVLFFNAKKNKTIALRADMDALPINEETTHNFKSTHKGMMHACGHDGHMAMLLGACDYIDRNFSSLNKNIVVIFQPSEELCGGSKSIIDSGLLYKYNVSEIYGFHIWPKLEKGVVFTRENELMSNSNEVDIKIIGKSSHAASANLGIDALYIGAKYLLDCYDMEKNLDNIFDKKPLYRLLKFGEFKSGSIRNVISDYTLINGTMRTYDEKVLDYMKDQLINISKKYEEEYKCKFEFEFRGGYPAVNNTSEIVKNLTCKIKEIKLLDKPVMQAEDFGLYLKTIKGAFMFLGAGDVAPLHNSKFDFDNDILSIGVQTYIKIVNL